MTNDNLFSFFKNKQLREAAGRRRILGEKAGLQRKGQRRHDVQFEDGLSHEGL